MLPADVAELLPRPDPDEPGLVVSIATEGAEPLREARGVADRSTGAPLDVDSIFYVGSIAKQFVAACIASLSRDGRLDVHDPITAYVPELPSWWSSVELRHLIHHTAGLPAAYRPDGWIDPSGVPAWSNEDLLAEVTRIPQPIDPPGTTHRYAGDGYVLLAEVVRRVTGAPLGAIARERLFEPLGMADSWFRERETPLPTRAARGHFRASDGRLHVEPARFHSVGSGGLWTTAADLEIWAQELTHGRLLDGSLAKTLTTRGALSDGHPIHYAWGLSVRTHRGLPIVSHGGTFPGWESKFVVFPEQQTAIVVLANSQELDVSTLAFRIADDVLAGETDPAASHADRTFDA